MPKGMRLLLCVAQLIVGCSVVLAQVGTQGSLLGTVVDASGAAVPGADITATNIETGIASKSVSDASGNFEILALPVGRYSVAVSAPGFKTWRLASTAITVGERTRISPALEVGDASQQVSVESKAELLQT